MIFVISFMIHTSLVLHIYNDPGYNYASIICSTRINIHLDIIFTISSRSGGSGDGDNESDKGGGENTNNSENGDGLVDDSNDYGYEGQDGNTKRQVGSNIIHLRQKKDV